MSKGRVLVVDDEADVRKSVHLILSKAGFDVDEAEDPESGAALVKSGANKLPLNAIITDLNMPKINEVIVVPYLRSQFPSCPIVVLSGSKMLDRSASLNLTSSALVDSPVHCTQQLLLINRFGEEFYAGVLKESGGSIHHF